MSTTTNKSVDREKLKENWVSNFEMLKSVLPSNDGAWAELRELGITTFREKGFPTTRNEEWKYSGVAGILKQELKPAFVDPKSDLTEEDIKEFLLDNIAQHRLVFVNGFYSAALSRHDQNIVVNLASNNPGTIGKHADTEADGFAGLNAAFGRDGAMVTVKDGNEIEDVIHVLNISDSRKEGVLSNSRNLIEVGANAKVTVVESWHTIGGNNSLTNATTEIVVGNGGKVEYYMIQADKDLGQIINTTQIVQEANSDARTVTVTAGGAFVRNNLNFRHKGKGCESHLYGLYVGKNENHIDNHSLVDHALPDCQSNQLYKGILAGNSTGVFNGKVIVRQDAQRTNAFQSNKNVLISDDATINTKPQLEIFADDVKCSHGATTGKLDQTALFYLRARGIGEKEAKMLLTQAFAADVLSEVKHEGLRDHLLEKASNWLLEIDKG